MLDALRAAGNPQLPTSAPATDVFGYFESDDLAAAERYLAAQEVSARWQERRGRPTAGTARSGQRPAGAAGDLQARLSPKMVDRQLEYPRMVAWMRRISARPGLNVGTAMPCARPH